MLKLKLVCLVTLVSVVLTACGHVQNNDTRTTTNNAENVIETTNSTIGTAVETAETAVTAETVETTVTTETQKPVYRTYKEYLTEHNRGNYCVIPKDLNGDGSNEVLLVKNPMWSSTLLYKKDGLVVELYLESNGGGTYYNVDDHSFIHVSERGDSDGTFGYVEATKYVWNGTDYVVDAHLLRKSGSVERDADNNVILETYGQAYINDIEVDNETFESVYTITSMVFLPTTEECVNVDGNDDAFIAVLDTAD